MSNSIDEKTLRGRFIAGWNALALTNFTVLYDNSVVAKTPPARFIRFAVRPSDEKQKALGGNKVRTDIQGRVWMTIGVPNTDADKAQAIADAAKAIFRLWRSPDVDLHCLDIEHSTRSDPTHHLIDIKVRYKSIHYT